MEIDLDIFPKSLVVRSEQSSGSLSEKEKKKKASELYTDYDNLVEEFGVDDPKGYPTKKCPSVLHTDSIGARRSIVVSKALEGNTIHVPGTIGIQLNITTLRGALHIVTYHLSSERLEFDTQVHAPGRKYTSSHNNPGRSQDFVNLSTMRSFLKSEYPKLGS